MNLAKYSLGHPKIIYFFLGIMLLGGIISFGKLGKKEDAPFVIKQVVLITQYPGATPAEVEQLITEPIEREIQSMGNVYKVQSDSYYGMSKITIELLPSTPPHTIPQRWDELRRKVLNVQPNLPSGASEVIVNDDFGDVFGIYYGLTADDGFSYEELRTWGQKLKTELTPIDGVQKVTIFGEQYEVINIYISSAALANLGVDPNTIAQTISTQNQLVNTGVKEAGAINIRVVAGGTYTSLDDIRDQLIVASDGHQVRLGDIATVEKGYMDPPSVLMRVNGKRALGIGVASAGDKDVVLTGDLVEQKIAQLMPMMPIGMELVTLYPENEIAREANNSFIINLLESVVIVVLILMLVMGMRASLLIGSSLIFAICGTLLIMQFMGTSLNRTSLAGFIIAMGMLVDNAIVVTDNAQIAMIRGKSKWDALIDGATGPQWALLGATLIGIISFLPLYLAPSAAAEIVKPLFIVLAVSLLLSWILALIQTTVFGNFMLKAPKAGAEFKDPYDKPIYNKFTTLLSGLIRWRWTTLIVIYAAFVGSLILMGRMPQSFFPSLSKPYFRADCFFPDGYSIKDVEERMLTIDQWLEDQEAVRNVSITMGQGPLRYYLASAQFGPYPNYANILIEVSAADSSAVLEERFNAYINENYPDIRFKSSLFKVSPVPDAAIEFGFIGDNVDTLEMLAIQAQELMKQSPLVGDVRSSWGNKVPVLTPVYSQDKGQRLGITRQSMARYTTISTTGLPVGEYRQGDQFMPILIKDEKMDNFNLPNFGSIPVFNNRGDVVSLDQIVDSISLSYQYSVIKRYNRQKMIKAQCEPLYGANTKEAFLQVSSLISGGMTLPEGYALKIVGEEESQGEANSAIASMVPISFALIFTILLLLFGTYRKPTVILLMIPLIFIGVVLGLNVLGKSFDFFALLGLLGLVGMNIKNAVVLVDQIGFEVDQGLTPYDAVIAATKSRIVPVTMASGTTILGMLPLLPDALFGGMAATIMGGLLVATFLTIAILPVTYCAIFRIKSPKAKQE